MSLSKILSFSLDDPSSITSLGITLMLMLMGFIYYYFYSNSSSSSATKKQISSSIQKRFKYDVFISFRGEDSCRDFVDCLYHSLMKIGAYTYKVGENIQNGEGLSFDLIKAIEDSKFYIIVLSKKYASSSWCLEELVKIMKCRKKDEEHTAFPVFYDVKPTEVIDQSWSVEKAFSDKKKNKTVARKWKGALREAASLPGWELNTLDGLEAAGLAGLELKNTLDGHETKFNEEILLQMIKQGMKMSSSSSYRHSVTPATYFFQFLGQLWANYYPRVVEVDLTPGSAFSFIIWCLLVFAGLKSQSVTGFPFKTRPNAIKVPVTSLLIYAFASMAELVVSVAGLDRTSVYAIIARLGRISSLCLFVTSLAILIYI